MLSVGVKMVQNPLAASEAVYGGSRRARLIEPVSKQERGDRVKG